MQSYIKHLPYASAICQHQVTIFFDRQLLISGQPNRLSPQNRSIECLKCIFYVPDAEFTEFTEFTDASMPSQTILA